MGVVFRARARSRQAAWSQALRRDPPLLPVESSPRYASFVDRGFRSRGDARGLDVDQWVARFRDAEGQRSAD